MTVADDFVYAATVDARLVCLNRQDGSFCDRFGARGQIDLTTGLRRKPEYAGEYGVSSPPAVYRDLVIVGSFVADNSRARMASRRGPRLRSPLGRAAVDISPAAGKHHCRRCQHVVTHHHR